MKRHGKLFRKTRFSVKKSNGNVIVGVIISILALIGVCFSSEHAAPKTERKTQHKPVAQPSMISALPSSNDVLCGKKKHPLSAVAIDTAEEQLGIEATKSEDPESHNRLHQFLGCGSFTCDFRPK
jgi:hypothetical protein